jgi:hypothetical protein
MVTIVAIYFIRSFIRKEKDMNIYSHIQKDHPIISKQVVTVVDLGYHGIEKDYHAV